MLLSPSAWLYPLELSASIPPSLSLALYWRTKSIHSTIIDSLPPSFHPSRGHQRSTRCTHSICTPSIRQLDGPHSRRAPRAAGSEGICAMGGAAVCCTRTRQRLEPLLQRQRMGLCENSPSGFAAADTDVTPSKQSSRLCIDEHQGQCRRQDECLLLSSWRLIRLHRRC